MERDLQQYFQYFLTDAVSRCQQGSSDDFKVIVDAFDNRLYRTAWLITRDAGLAEDAVQETFVRGWKQIRSLKTPEALGAWLTRILVNYLKNRVRRREVSTVRLDAAAPLADTAPLPEDTVFTADVLAEFRRVVLELPFDQRTVVVLRHYDGLSLEEIARATGSRVGTVKSRLHRATRTVRERLQESQLRGLNRAEEVQ